MDQLTTLVISNYNNRSVGANLLPESERSFSVLALFLDTHKLKLRWLPPILSRLLSTLDLAALWGCEGGDSTMNTLTRLHVCSLV